MPKFSTKWLITHEQCKDVKAEQVQVYFADEPIGNLQTFGREFGGTL